MLHPRLRRQLGSSRGEGAAVPAEWRELVDEVDRSYRKADEERALLEESVRALTSLLKRAQDAQGSSESTREERRARARAAAKKLARALEKSGTPIFELTPELEIVSANPAAVRLCGKDALAGTHLFSHLEPLQPEAVAARWKASLAKLSPVAETVACQAPDKRALACDFVCVPKFRRGGKLKSITALVRDETARVEAQEARREREERMGLALAGGSDVLWDWDLRANRLFLSPRFRELLGDAGPVSRTPADWLERVHPDDQPQLKSALAAHFDGRAATLDHEHRVRSASGEWHWMWVRGAAIRDAQGAAVRAVGLMSDVTRHRLLVDRMAHDARHDALTGLPNRTLFLDLLRHSFHRLRRHDDYRFAVLFIDIDHFKSVNDTLGHEAGDQLLVQIARRLESCLRQGDTLARHAGDEFTMRLDDVRGTEDALRVADRVHEVMREPFHLGREQVRSSASIGLAIGSPGYAQAEEVLRDADAAMYRAKAMGKARTTIFERTDEGGAPQLESDLRRAIARNELRVFYMPIVGVGSGKLEGLEALARWQHPKLGLVSPSSFIALAERTGLIASIDRWVLETASRQLRDWRRELTQASRTSLSVNFSQMVLEQNDLAAQVAGVLRDVSLEPRDLHLDVSETSVAAPGKALAELHARGLSLAMDDFGTGQSWLRNLHAGEVDSVKIDRSFIAAGAGPDREVLRRIVSIARDLGKKVIAEGVETAEQLKTVREVGCHAAQGYLFSAPLDALKTRSLLETGMAKA